MKNFKIETLLQSLIHLGLGLTGVALIAMPMIVTAYFKSAYQVLNQPVITAVIIGLYLCALPYVWALVNLSVLANMIQDANPFSKRSVLALRWISLSSFSEIIIITSVTLFIKGTYSFFEHSLVIAPLAIIIFLCLVFGLLCFVLSKLFDSARVIKLENDMTV